MGKNEAAFKQHGACGGSEKLAVEKGRPTTSTDKARCAYFCLSLLTSLLTSGFFAGQLTETEITSHQEPAHLALPVVGLPFSTAILLLSWRKYTLYKGKYSDKLTTKLHFRLRLSCIVSIQTY